MTESRKTLVDMDELELTQALAWTFNGTERAENVARIIRRMIENSLLEAGVKSDD